MSHHATIPGKMVQGLFKRVLAPDLTPELIIELAAVGIDLSVPPPPTYPRSAWYQAIALTAKSLFPDHREPAQLRKFGGHIIQSLQTRDIIKSTWLTMARFAGPRRALKQAMDFTDRSPVKLTINELSKTEFEIGVDDKEQPDFLAGVLEAAVTMLGGKSAAVSLKGPQGESNLFRATWK
jgi:uncharacterized protein (TIGR02265 family)